MACPEASARTVVLNGPLPILWHPCVELAWREPANTLPESLQSMPAQADSSQRPSQIRLSNGLRVRLLSLPESTQAAAFVRVHAGAHDAPADYPGLAHFLEHLLFLGSLHYPIEQSLMPFVQACGGQLNASTRERHTDYFFQVPADRLEEGLLRLMDLLARPLLDRAAQLREREVLHAEYRARAEDVETLCDAALGQVIGVDHPFGAFHAGNRETLPVEQASLQQALLDFHQNFYRTGQIELLLAGPKTHNELLQLARLAEGSLVPGPGIQRDAPSMKHPQEAWLRLQLDKSAPRALLAFTLDGMPEYSQPALDYLASWIASEAPESLLSRLRQQGLCQTLKLRVPYWYAGQGVVVIEAVLTEQGLAQRVQLVDALRDWLRFFSADDRWQVCREQYLCVLRRSLQVAEPLGRLRHWIEPLAWSNSSDEAAVRQALARVLAQMLATPPVVLTADMSDCKPIETAGFPLRLRFEAPEQAEPIAWHWQPPQANPWLQAGPRGQAYTLEPSLRWRGPEDVAGRAVLYLHWRLTPGTATAGYAQALQHALQTQVWTARQAGVELRFEDQGHAWLLSLYGIAEAIPLILQDLGSLLARPPQAALALGPQLAERAFRLGGDEMILRQLLALLPRVQKESAPEAEQAPLDQTGLDQHWRKSERQGLALGFPADLSGPLQAAITALPGRAASKQPEPAASGDDHLWHQLGSQENRGETALLLFCSLPRKGDYSDEASWRVLGRLLERAFFRRLRSELQLGYAVFSRFTFVAGQGGMLFAVQSPTASAAEILGHIESFLDDFAVQLKSQTVQIEEAARDLSTLHVAGAADLRTHAEQSLQAWLAGYDDDHQTQVAQAMANLSAAQVLAALEALQHGPSGWRVLANAAAPDNWQRPAKAQRLTT